MKVKILTSIASPIWGAPAPGQYAEIPDDEAKALIARGFAEAAEEPTIEKAVKRGYRKAVKE